MSPSTETAASANPAGGSKGVRKTLPTIPATQQAMDGRAKQARFRASPFLRDSASCSWGRRRISSCLLLFLQAINQNMR